MYIRGIPKLLEKYPHQYDPGFGTAREWKNSDVASILYMIKYGDINSNIDTDDILLLLSWRDTEDCMDA